jgi:hypothetical protein
MEARVTVTVHNGDSFAPEVVSVESRLPWLWFETVEDNRRRVVVIPDTSIAKIEIAFVPKSDKGPVGFTVRETVKTVAEQAP